MRTSVGVAGVVRGTNANERQRMILLLAAGEPDRCAHLIDDGGKGGITGEREGCLFTRAKRECTSRVRVR